MTYQDIRDNLSKEKLTWQNTKMIVIPFSRFSVMKSSDDGDEILVDPDVARKVDGRKWCIDSGGYPVVRLNGQLVRLFDVVMSQYFDEKPKGCFVDHINHDKLDNRIINLRFVTPAESSRNMPLKRDNKSGHTGVCKTPKNTYRAYITINKKQINLGYYQTLEEAVSARREAEDRFHFDTRPVTIREAFERAERKMMR